MPETYVSTDVETDGPIPGPHSMLSLGSAAYTADGELLGTYSVNLETLPGAAAHPRTAAWWAGHPGAWAACREGARPPEEAMAGYARWVRGLPGRPVFAAWPAGFDFLFVQWYLVRFTGDSPFSHSALDLKTLAMALLGTEYRRTVKGTLPRRWRSRRPHTHVALDDALEQGELLVRMLRERPAGPLAGAHR